MRRGLAIGLAAVLGVGVVIAIVASLTGGTNSGVGPTPTTQRLALVKGVIGTEKQPFFADPAVIREFARRGGVRANPCNNRDPAVDCEFERLISENACSDTTCRKPFRQRA